MRNRVEILGINYDRIDLIGLINFCIKTIEQNQKSIILYHNLHSIFLFHKDSYFANCFKHAALILADGMPLIFWAKLLRRKQVSRDFRITYVDLLPELLKEMNKKKLKLFFLGGPPNFGERVKEFISVNYPEIEFKYEHGFFDSARNSSDSQQVIQSINSFQPHVTLVGMGMPIQEKWICNHFSHINTNVFLAGGACMEYFTGVVSKPPRWAGRFGLEWLYRLMESPKRYYFRYLVEPFSLIPYFFKDVISRK
jgi:N-acetylglucosaminyldiphosphoundecaprenol N-acetyl-beta-D-mannosaminyltransferase